MACDFEEDDLCLREEGWVYGVPTEDGGEGVFVVTFAGGGGGGGVGRALGLVLVKGWVRIVLACVVRC